MIRAVLFDAGATLLHADPPVEEIYLREFERDGVTEGHDAVRRALARTWREVKEKQHQDRYGGVSGERGFWEMFIRRARHHVDGRELSAKCFQSLVDHFVSPASWALFPDARPALEALRSRGLLLAVVSNWDSSLVTLLDSLEISGYFAASLISAVEQTGKPHPEIFLRACARLGVEPGNTLHVGDSIDEDFDAARGAGLRAVLIDRGGQHPHLQDRIETLASLPGWIEKLAGVGVRESAR